MRETPFGQGHAEMQYDLRGDAAQLRPEQPGHLRRLLLRAPQVGTLRARTHLQGNPGCNNWGALYMNRQRTAPPPRHDPKKPVLGG